MIFHFLKKATCIALSFAVVLSILTVHTAQAEKSTYVDNKSSGLNTLTTAKSPKPISLKGRVVKFISYMSNMQPGDDCGVTQATDQKSVEYRARIIKIQKDYNCTIRFVGIDRLDNTTVWQKTLDSSLSGKPIADLAYISPEYVYKSVALGGAYSPLDKYNSILDLNNSSLWQVAVNKKLFVYNGMSLALVAKPIGFEAVNRGYVTFFNKSLLIREGLWSKYNLYAMQKSNHWNWNTLSLISSKVSKDTNRDGKTDIFGLGYSENALRAMMHTNSSVRGNGGWTMIAADGSAKIMTSDAQHMSAINFLTNLYKKGQLFCDGSGTRENAAMSKFIKGQLAFDIDYGSYLGTFALFMPDTFGVLAIPLSASKTAPQEYLLPYNNPQPFVMCGSVSKPLEIAYMMRELVPPEQMTASQELKLGNDAIKNYTRGEVGITDTYQLLAQPSRIVTDPDIIMKAIVDVPMYLFMSNVQFAIQGFTTISQVNQASLPRLQSSMNECWKTVIDGSKKMKKKYK